MARSIGWVLSGATGRFACLHNPSSLAGYWSNAPIGFWRRRAARAEFSDQEWQLVSELADYPNRLLVTVTTESGEMFAEVAHEAIFRRWDKLRDWIAAEREFLAWRSGLEAARRAWQQTPNANKTDALLMGLPLAQARSWVAKRAEDIPPADRDFILQSRIAAQRRTRRMRALISALALTIVAGLISVAERVVSAGALAVVHGHPPVHADAGSALRADRRG